MFIYAIKDTISGNFEVPFAAHNNAVAERAFAEEANTRQSKVCIFAKDMQLYKIAEWNIKTGEVKPDLEFLANAIDYRKIKVEE